MNSDSDGNPRLSGSLARRLAERLFGPRRASTNGAQIPAALPVKPAREAVQASLFDGPAMPFLAGVAVGAAAESAQPKGEPAHIKMSLEDECEERQKREDRDRGYDRHELGRDTGLGL
jgi:hypothetical protein